MVEFERAARGHGKRRRLRWRADLGDFGEQLGQPLGRTRGAEQVAIDFGQRAERARHQRRGDEEARKRPRRQPAGGDIADGRPHQQRDRAEQQPHHQRGHDRARRDPALCGVEAAIDRGGEARFLARFLAERLDYLHRGEGLDRHRPDIGDAVLARARLAAHAAAEQHDRQDDQRHADHDRQGHFRREDEQQDHAADPGEAVAERDRHRRADRTFDQRGVRGQPRGDFGRTVLLEPARREPQQVGLHRDADVGDGAFAEPRHEVEADRGRDREDDDEAEQIVEDMVDMRDVAGAVGEAAVDHRLDAPRCRERRRRRDEQRHQRDRELERIARGVAPHHCQAGELSPARPGLRDGRIDRDGGGLCFDHLRCVAGARPCLNPLRNCGKPGIAVCRSAA